MKNELLESIIYHTCYFQMDDEHYSLFCRACEVEQSTKQSVFEEPYDVINIVDLECDKLARWLDGVKASDFGDDDGLSGVLAVIK